MSSYTYIYTSKDFRFIDIPMSRLTNNYLTNYDDLTKKKYVIVNTPYCKRGRQSAL